MDEVESMPARRFFLLAERLPAYGGVVANAMRRATADTPAAVTAEPAQRAAVMIGPQQVPQLLGQELYGQVPGLAAVISYSTAPLAPEDEGGGNG